MPSWKKVIISGSDASLNSLTVSTGVVITGSIIATNTVSGSTIYSTGDVIAAVNLKSMFSSGDEGGEIFLNKSVTNTAITGGVTIDVYQNRLRIYEQGGTNRGGYYDITALSASVGSNLLTGGGGGSTTPGGSSGQIQYNNSSTFGGVSNLTWDGTTLKATGSFSGSFTGILTGTASYAALAATASYLSGSILGVVGTTATLGTPIPYGSGVTNTVTSSAFISIYNTGATSKIFLANTSTTQQQALQIEENGQYSGMYRYGSATALTVLASSTLPSSNALVFNSGNTNLSPIYILGRPIVNAIGTTSTNVATRLDATGFRIGTNADIDNSNTIPFEVNGTTKITGSLTVTQGVTGSIRAVQTTANYAGYFENNAYNLGGGNAITIYDGGAGTTLGLGYGTTTDRLWSAAQGLYIGGHGSFGVYFETTGFVSSGKARIGDANYNAGGTLELISAGSGSSTTLLLKNTATTEIVKVLDNGAAIITGSLAIKGLLTASGSTVVAGYNPTPLAGTIKDGVTSVLGDLQDWNSDYYQGDVLYSEISGEAINYGHLCYRDRFGKWLRADGTSIGDAAKSMLGICLHTVGAADTATSILTRGYVETTYTDGGNSGTPLYLKNSAGSITYVAPSAAGNIVRIIGHVFWNAAMQANSVTIIHFNPDNTWIEL